MISFPGTSTINIKASVFSLRIFFYKLRSLTCKYINAVMNDISMREMHLWKKKCLLLHINMNASDLVWNIGTQIVNNWFENMIKIMLYKTQNLTPLQKCFWNIYIIKSHKIWRLRISLLTEGMWYFYQLKV